MGIPGKWKSPAYFRSNYRILELRAMLHMQLLQQLPASTEDGGALVQDSRLHYSQIFAVLGISAGLQTTGNRLLGSMLMSGHTLALCIEHSFQIIRHLMFRYFVAGRHTRFLQSSWISTARGTMSTLRYLPYKAKNKINKFTHLFYLPHSF
jgi:hypothetical protein